MSKRKKFRFFGCILLCLGGIILLLVGIVVVYWIIPYSPQKNRFNQQMEDYSNKINAVNEVCTREEIAALPEPLQRYCNYIGLENSPKYSVVRTIFSNTKFVFDSKSGKKLNMDYDLWLFYPQPFRSAFCKSSMYGIPFDGVDYFNEDLEGGMKGVLGKAIQIFDVHNKQGYQAGLISWLAESLMINPSTLFSKYITYEVIDDNHVKATILYNGVSGSGIISIDESGAITEFYSDERQVEMVNGEETKIGWRCEYEDYQLQNGIVQPGTIRCIKVYPDKEVTYFDSDDFVIEYKK